MKRPLPFRVTTVGMDSSRVDVNSRVEREAGFEEGRMVPGFWRDWWWWNGGRCEENPAGDGKTFSDFGCGGDDKHSHKLILKNSICSSTLIQEPFRTNDVRGFSRLLYWFMRRKSTVFKSSVRKIKRPSKLQMTDQTWKFSSRDVYRQDHPKRQHRTVVKIKTTSLNPHFWYFLIPHLPW